MSKTRGTADLELVRVVAGRLEQDQHQDLLLHQLASHCCHTRVQNLHSAHWDLGSRDEHQPLSFSGFR